VCSTAARSTARARKDSSRQLEKLHTHRKRRIES